MNLDTEPVRLPLWATTIIVVAIQVAVAILSGTDWKPALIQGLLSLAALLGGTEYARSKAYSPDTVKQIRAKKAAK